VYYLGNCRCCQQGLLGIRICCDDEIGLVVCDECEAIWLEPECTGDPLTPAQPDSRCPRCQRPIWQRPGHWASWAEVERLGWEGVIQGFVRTRRPTPP
jgi:hypothetical protein